MTLMMIQITEIILVIKMILEITTMKMMITRHKIMVSIKEKKSYYSDDADDDTRLRR